jgi:hypothetical protein
MSFTDVKAVRLTTAQGKPRVTVALLRERWDFRGAKGDTLPLHNARVPKSCLFGAGELRLQMADAKGTLEIARAWQNVPTLASNKARAKATA